MAEERTREGCEGVSMNKIHDMMHGNAVINPTILRTN